MFGTNFTQILIAGLENHVERLVGWQFSLSKLSKSQSCRLQDRNVVCRDPYI